MKSLIESLPLPRLYYYPETGSYLRKDNAGRWMSINGGDAQRYLIEQGYHRNHPANQSEVNSCILRVQNEQNVAYAGPLAGYQAGTYSISGQTVLVDSSPNIIQPKEGDWPILRQVFEAVLRLEQAEHETDQLDCFYGWLAAAYKAISSGQWSPGQVMVLAGPAEAGKSLLQWIITQILGGRSARPYHFMSDGTQFNKDLFGAEHLVIEDESESTRINDRRKFGANIKGFSVNAEHRVHGKGKDAATLTPIWRVSVSLNDTPERIKVLPPLEEDIRDKIIILKAYRRQMPMPTLTHEDKARFRQRIMEELPAFIDYLMKLRPRVVGEVNRRFGVTTYQNQDIVDLLTGQYPESQLLEIMDAGYFAHHQDNLVGTARLILQRLSELPDVGDEVKQLVKASEVMGMYLGRMVENPQFHGRVTKVSGPGRMVTYTITPPPPA